ncbi:L-lactate dehydrogenase [Staphylococcus devriesei]|uniref:L-lactate dehydrogenase n=1 Tax=Staphylococcus devriesei TaxID=586733 RepID=A0ABX5I379_9STAP|nr:L-lactate dehydrogenase [Staphylococcus devriesei]MCE5097000.1 L-lactate dehydrogenase [Staphylococcus devriesei]PNZ89203.1 L-lactate dehydrogenase [Staphylococcus devriesei]PTF14950.1 L-lactate dehydrogenase [Staphylococcus devriesei]PTF19624.1 L-lactate dehydrogenase [Staphylococcus devriesei]SUM02683.1 L-lactate dehydrogenase [Staphylococcus devriesei]
MSRHKIVLIGSGYVGSAFTHAIVAKGLVDELAIIDIDEDKAKADVWDLNHATPFSDSYTDVHVGSYEDCSNADIVVICASAIMAKGDTRLQLLEDNVEIFVPMIQQVINHGFDGYFVLPSNPVDIMSYVIKRVSHFPKNKIIGSGTSLDTARFEFFLSRALNVAPQSVYAPVIGEHGDSQVQVWSHAQVAGEPVLDLLTPNVDKATFMQSISTQTTQVGYDIYVRKGTTNFGISLSLVRIVEAILFNKNIIMNVSSYIEGEYGLNGLYIGTPTVINGNGADRVIELALEEDELVRFKQSANVIKDYQQRADRIIEKLLS